MKRPRKPRALPAPERKVDPKLQGALDDEARVAAALLDLRLARTLSHPTGFVLWLFNRDGPEFTFIGNVDRQDMDRAIERLIVSWNAGLWTRDVQGQSPPGGVPRPQALPPPAPRQIERK
ncbi:MAG TPA: hypothetical protein VKV41_25325 [Methylomirabilota bacterium]|nr:hypothetical protein [Methylomirabilota bacterium]